MGNQLVRGGNYGAYSPSGAPIGLSPAMLEALIIDPTIRSMIAAGGRQAPDQNQMGGLMNWAKSQAGSSRSILPTIPGLTVPPAVQQILAQVAPLSSKANQLAGTVTGGQAVNPATGQFAPPGQVAGTPTSQAQQPTSGATGQASPDFVTQIVQRAVQAALSGVGGGGDIAPGVGTGTQPGGGSSSSYGESALGGGAVAGGSLGGSSGGESSGNFGGVDIGVGGGGGGSVY